MKTTDYLEQMFKLVTVDAHPEVLEHSLLVLVLHAADEVVLEGLFVRLSQPLTVELEDLPVPFERVRDPLADE